MRWWWMVVAVVLGAVPVNAALTRHCLTIAADGTPTLKGPCPQTENHMHLECLANTSGGHDCDFHAGPIEHLEDADGNGLSTTTLTMRADGSIEFSEPDNNVGGIGLSSSYVFALSSLSIWTPGGCTNDRTCSINAAWDFVSSPTQNGKPFGASHAAYPLVTGYTLSAGRRFGPMWGGAVGSSRDNAAGGVTLPGRVRTMTVTAIIAGVVTALPVGNDVDFGLVITGSDSATICTLTAGQSFISCSSPPTVNEAIGDTDSVWMQGTGSSGTVYDFRVGVGYW